MYLVQKLIQAGVVVKIQTCNVERTNVEGRKLSRATQRMQLVRKADEHILAEELGSLSSFSGEGIRTMLLRCLQKARNESEVAPIYAQARDEEGLGPVVFDGEHVEEDSYYRIHVALRKAMDGPVSAILWNVLHELEPVYTDILANTTSQALKTLRSERSQSPENTKRPLTRKVVGQAIRRAWERAGEKMLEALEAQRDTLSPKQLQQQRFEVLMFTQGVALMSQDDWTWGMTAYLVQDAPPPG